MTNQPSSFECLSDRQLLTEVNRLASSERQATADLIGSLMELDARRLYLGEGCSSLFTYCTQVLHMSEHAAYGRIEAARAGRRFPMILDLLRGQAWAVRDGEPFGMRCLVHRIARPLSVLFRAHPRRSAHLPTEEDTFPPPNHACEGTLGHRFEPRTSEHLCCAGTGIPPLRSSPCRASFRVGRPRHLRV